LPEKYVWPEETVVVRIKKGFFPFRSYEEKTVIRPLSFIAQINMADVKPYDSETLLPANGILYFFYSATADGFGPPNRHIQPKRYVKWLSLYGF
jgi:uncharacterized protein YwqG